MKSMYAEIVSRAGFLIDCSEMEQSDSEELWRGHLKTRRKNEGKSNQKRRGLDLLGFFLRDEILLQSSV